MNTILGIQHFLITQDKLSALLKRLRLTVLDVLALIYNIIVI